MAHLIKDYSSKAKQLLRPSMEDYYNIFFSDGFFSMNVCDGHGGCEAAEFVNKQFSNRLLDVINKDDPIKNINDLISNMDEEIKKQPWGKTVGTTLAAVAYNNNKLYFINVGDSHIITPLFSNKLHVPSDLEERERILKYDFIKNERISGIINLSRALGDFEFKKGAMISTPDISVFDVNDYLRHSCPWILIASDGLTLLFDREKIKVMIDSLFKIGKSSSYIVNKIIDTCVNNNNKDNTTVILLRLLNV